MPYWIKEKPNWFCMGYIDTDPPFAFKSRLQAVADTFYNCNFSKKCRLLLLVKECYQKHYSYTWVEFYFCGFSVLAFKRQLCFFLLSNLLEMWQLQKCVNILHVDIIMVIIQASLHNCWIKVFYLPIYNHLCGSLFDLKLNNISVFASFVFGVLLPCFL